MTEVKEKASSTMDTIMGVYIGIYTRSKTEEESDPNNICHSLVTYSCGGGANPHWQQLSYKQSVFQITTTV